MNTPVMRRHKGLGEGFLEEAASKMSSPECSRQRGRAQSFRKLRRAGGQRGERLDRQGRSAVVGDCVNT